ncbi:polysaccharide deacetylase family protein [Paenibacillus mesophilus]|uniref:polysaccharide deacetylase family protein n=1 Tax=Paenibacillus mesophilus TaxID=2582849 RepID=UPI00110E202A|nr:polysaccharide deacetylase family protein [Paenibacillus mesophilus]TMV51320.1 polysaccharide deacetylase family protein [Paenibacillus mesophilus]
MKTSRIWGQALAAAVLLIILWTAGSTVQAAGKPEIAKLYKMNNHYDIVPIDPSGNKKVVLLTFDDGPKDKTRIEQILAALDKHKAKAIFFVNGYRVRNNPELLKLLHDRGHTIGNHSWDHIDLKKEQAERITRQIQDVQQIVKSTIGVDPKFFRPPFGSSNEFVKKLVKDEGMLFMTWSNGSEDWLSSNRTPEGVVGRVLEQLHPGSNILMHELPWTAHALDELLTKLADRGYGFVDPDSIDTTISAFVPRTADTRK